MGWLRFGVLAVGSFDHLHHAPGHQRLRRHLRGKTPDAWYMLGYLASLCILLASYAARYSIFSHAGVATGQFSNLIVFGVACLIQFAYCYGGLDRPREARIVLVVSLALAAGVWGANFFLSSAPRVYDFEAEYFTYEYGPHVSVFALAGYLWAFCVLVRRALGASARGEAAGPPAAARRCCASRSSTW